ncbi:hypothetical protein [Natrialba aegyptia]|uniref:hypothetical protein n=1 Tax=Natrialba aegyptia TaxID=129789 RepID=UPI000AC8448F|nr:hypothetical protein [Natrialba aegyptia]
MCFGAIVDSELTVHRSQLATRNSQLGPFPSVGNDRNPLSRSLAETYTQDRHSH